MPAEASLIILIPVLDDWKALSLMLPRLARAIGEPGVPLGLLIVDDGSSVPEDRPEDGPRLVARMRSEPSPRIVFGERRRRVEGLGFRSLHVLRSRQPWCAVPVSRDRRLDGTSRMNFVSLVVHGLSAISVYTDVVFTRIICASAALMAMTFAAIAGVVAIKTSASVVIPGWAYSLTGLLLVVLLQAVTFTLSLVFVILGAQEQSAVIPLRDYGHYVAGVLEIATDQPG